jgi:hypothetical protein
MRHVFAKIFRWAATLLGFFTSALRIIFPAVAPLAGFLSAAFWFWSALVPIPKNFPVIVVTGGGLDGPLDEPLGGGSVGIGSSPNLTMLGDQLAWQSQLNKYAAICAAVAAISVSLRVAAPLARNRKQKVSLFAGHAFSAATFAAQFVIITAYGASGRKFKHQSPSETQRPLTF